MSERSDLPISARPDAVGQAAGSGRGAGEDLFSLAFLGSVLFRHVRTVIVAPLALGTLLIAYGALRARYVAESRFTPASSKSGLQGLSGVAAQLGFNVGSLAPGQSVDFYAQLVLSRDLLTRVVNTRYRFPVRSGDGDTLSGTLLQFYRVSGHSSADSMLRAIAVLRNQLSVSTDQAANTVTIVVAAEWPGLSEQINRTLLDEINRFNVEQLQFQASAERRFIEGRVADAKAELDSAEGRLRGFLEKNRTFQDSPRLQFEEQRLQALMTLRQQVYTTLTQSYEQARIAEVRDTPVITVIDSPAGSAERHRHILRNGFLGVILGLVLGIGLSFGMEFARQERIQNPEEYSEFVRLRQSVWRRVLASPFQGQARRE